MNFNEFQYLNNYLLRDLKNNVKVENFLLENK